MFEPVIICTSAYYSPGIASRQCRVSPHAEMAQTHAPAEALAAWLPLVTDLLDVEGTSCGSIVLRDSARRSRAPGSSLPGPGGGAPGGAGPSWSSGRLCALYSFMPLPEESRRSCIRRKTSFKFPPPSDYLTSHDLTLNVYNKGKTSSEQALWKREGADLIHGKPACRLAAS
jgi:hypothetical protein